MSLTVKEVLYKENDDEVKGESRGSRAVFSSDRLSGSSARHPHQPLKKAGEVPRGCLLLTWDFSETLPRRRS